MAAFNSHKQAKKDSSVRENLLLDDSTIIINSVLADVKKVRRIRGNSNSNKYKYVAICKYKLNEEDREFRFDTYFRKKRYW